VLAHEAKFSHKFCEATGNVVALGHGPSAESALAADGVGLEHFVLPLHQHGVDLAAELKGCSDAWLMAQLGMQEAHVAKFRHAVGPDATTSADPAGSCVGASDGFVGSPVEVAAHEAKLRLLRPAPPPPFAPQQPRDRVLTQLYEVCARKCEQIFRSPSLSVLGL